MDPIIFLAAKSREAFRRNFQEGNNHLISPSWQPPCSCKPSRFHIFFLVKVRWFNNKNELAKIPRSMQFFFFLISHVQNMIKSDQPIRTVKSIGQPTFSFYYLFFISAMYRISSTQKLLNMMRQVFLYHCLTCYFHQKRKRREWKQPENDSIQTFYYELLSYH